MNCEKGKNGRYGSCWRNSLVWEEFSKINDKTHAVLQQKRETTIKSKK